MKCQKHKSKFALCKNFMEKGEAKQIVLETLRKVCQFRLEFWWLKRQEGKMFMSDLRGFKDVKELERNIKDMPDAILKK